MSTALAHAETEVLEPKAQAVLPPRNEIATVMHAITAAANDPNVDIDKMERLLSMHERMHARANEQKFNAAMTKAQAAMGPISADAVNPQTRSTYASYAQLNRALRPIYTKNGFALRLPWRTATPLGLGFRVAGSRPPRTVAAARRGLMRVGLLGQYSASAG